MKSTKWTKAGWLLPIALLLFGQCNKQDETAAGTAPGDEQGLFRVPAAGETIRVAVEQAADYSIEVPKEAAAWIVPTGESKAMGNRLEFRVEANDGYPVREAVVTLKDQSGKISTFTVSQRSNFVPTITDGWDIYDGGSYRYGPSIIIRDDGSIDTWFSAPGGQYGNNVRLYEDRGQNTPVNLGDGKSSVGQKFTTPTPFYGAGAVCVNWSGQTCGLRASLYKWSSSYAETVASAPLVQKSFTNYADGGFVHVTAEPGQKFPAGTYLWVLDQGATAHSGLWRHPGVVAGVTNFHNGQEVDYSLSGQYMLDYSEGSTFWDQAAYWHSADGGVSWGTEVMSLLPTEFSSDHFSVCDPGAARWGGYYYIGYTSTENPDMVQNNVYIARGLNPGGPWEKWNGSAWTTGTDVQPMIRYTDDPAAFGAGEPSIVVLNDTVYFYYSWDNSGTSVKTYLATADANDPLWPAHLTLHGAVIDKSAIGGSDHSDVKYREDIGKFQAIHTAARMGPNSYMVVWQSDDGIRFEKIAELRDNLQPYLHNCGWSGDEQGHMRAGVQQYVAYAYGTSWGQWKTRWSKVNF